MDLQGNIFVRRPNPAIPYSCLQQIQQNMQAGMSFHQSLKSVRNSQVPAGYEPHPFREGVDETLLDTMRSVVATLLYRYVFSASCNLFDKH